MTRSLRIQPPVVVVLVVAVLVLVLAIALAAGGDTLSLRRTARDNVTVVTITGPSSLLDRVAEVAALRQRALQHPSLGQSPCGPVYEAAGFVIAWGDGTSSPFSAAVLPAAPGGCPDPVSHAYAVPGTYTVTAYTY